MGSVTLPAYFVGELAAVIGLIAMFVGGETIRRPEPLRTVLGCIHGLAVLAGLVCALGTIEWEPTWLSVPFHCGNVFNFVVVAAMLAIVYPERREDDSSWPMWETTFGPVLVATIWGVGTAIETQSFGDLGSLLGPPALMLAVHYYLVSGTIIVMLLIEPPATAAAAQYTLRERMLSGFGVFWLVLMMLWWGQLWFVLDTHWDILFGDSWWRAVLAAALSIPMVIRNASHGRRQVHGGPR